MNSKIRVTEINNRRPLFPDLGEAWRHYGLMWMLVQRNVKVRYQQTLLGSAWIIIQPLILAGMLTLVAGRILKAPSDGLPYALFALTGSTIWNIFQRAVSETSISLASSSNIILKVYFPRIIVPLSSAITTIVDFLPIFPVLMIAIFFYGRFPGLPFLAMPFFLLLGLVLAFAIGLWVTMLDAIYRDLRMIVPSVLQAMLFASPVMYGLHAVPDKWRHLYEFNPMVGVLEGFRWSLIAGLSPPTFFSVAWAAGMSVVLLVSGMAIFSRLEQFAVDRI